MGPGATIADSYGKTDLGRKPQTLRAGKAVSARIKKKSAEKKRRNRTL